MHTSGKSMANLLTYIILMPTWPYRAAVFFNKPRDAEQMPFLEVYIW